MFSQLESHVSKWYVSTDRLTAMHTGPLIKSAAITVEYAAPKRFGRG